MVRTLRGSRTGHPGASARLTVEGEEDALADLLGVLAQGPSQWYTLNGDTSTKVSLCRVLGFFSEADYHALLVSKNLASYRSNKSSGKLEVVMLVDKWREYINNERYKIVSPVNAEIETKRVDIASLLSGRKQDNKQRQDYYVLRLGSRQSESYAGSISRQQIWLPQISGWRAKQRYFRHSVNDIVLKTQLESEDLYAQLLAELDQAKISSDAQKNNLNPTSDLPQHSPAERQKTGTAIAVTPLAHQAAEPLAGKFSKRQEPCSDHGIQYHELKGDNVKTYVKIPVLTTDHHYYGKKGKWIDDIIDTLSSKNLDRSGTVRRLTKALVCRDRSAVLDGLEDMNVRVIRPMDAVTKAALWKA